MLSHLTTRIFRSNTWSTTRFKKIEWSFHIYTVPICSKLFNRPPSRQFDRILIFLDHVVSTWSVILRFSILCIRSTTGYWGSFIQFENRYWLETERWFSPSRMHKRACYRVQSDHGNPVFPGFAFKLIWCPRGTGLFWASGVERNSLDDVFRLWISSYVPPNFLSLWRNHEGSHCPHWPQAEAGPRLSSRKILAFSEVW